MRVDLDERERGALRRRARIAIFAALESLGGEAERKELLGRAIAIARFSERELNAPAPHASAGKYERRVDFELSWALTNLKRDGLLENPRRSIWRLAGAAAERVPPHVEEGRGAERLSELRRMPYHEYLRTPEWRKTRAAALHRAGYSCSLDVAHTENLEVHHRTYDRLGEELDTDLLVLCRDCHRVHHANNGRAAGRSPSQTPPSVAPPTSVKATAPKPARPDRQRARPSMAKRRRAQDRVREFVVQLFALAGFVAGLLMGFAARPRTVDHAVCGASACIPAGLVAELRPIALYGIGGVMVGGAVGVVVALRIQLVRAS